MNVLFDLGNVLINWNTTTLVEGLDLPAAQKRLIQRELFDHSDWSDLDHGAVSEPAVVERICNRTTLSADAVNHALDAARASLNPISASVDLLYEIRDAGLPIYCLSNMSIETYQHIKERLAFFECFQGIIISGIEKCMKPSPDIFQLTLDFH